MARHRQRLQPASEPFLDNGPTGPVFTSGLFAKAAGKMIVSMLSSLQMDESAAEILNGWRKKRPPEVPKGDVARVVSAVFPSESFRLYEDAGGVKATHRGRTAGSHYLVIEDELLKLADEKGHGAFPGGVLLVPHTRGKVVKWVYVKKLIDAIDLRRDLEEFLRKVN